MNMLSLYLLCAAEATPKSDPIGVEGGMLLAYSLPPDRCVLSVSLFTELYLLSRLCCIVCAGKMT